MLMSIASLPDTVLETRHLRLVQAIAGEGSVTRAGDRLHLTQSAVSRQLAELEDRLGLRLFARVKKKLVITPAGSHLLDASRHILDDLVRAERELKLQGGPSERWPLRLSTGCYTCYHWLPPVLREFERRHPRADLHIVLEATPDPLPALKRGELELGIVSADVTSRELSVEPLFEDEVVAIVAPGHRFATRRFLEPSDVVGETLLAFGTTGPDAIWFQRRFLGRVKPGAFRPVPITEVLFDLVKADLGVAVVHRWTAEPHLRAGAVSACRLGRGGLWKTWKAVYPRATPHRDAIVDLVALIRSGNLVAGQRRLTFGRRKRA
jgi:LysR family transcriptional regulator, regulator for metE and metH